MKFRKVFTLIALMACMALGGCKEKTEPEPASQDTPETPETPVDPVPDRTGEDHSKQVTDVCFNKYKVVKIGNRYWMAENLRCARYDTDSELWGKYIDVNQNVYDGHKLPYYSDATDASWWNDNESVSKYAANVADAERKKLGYLYNWISAAGFTTYADACMQQGAFVGTRQGICPNGFHLPTYNEWIELGLAAGGVMSTFTEGRVNNAGVSLKSKSGWYDSSEDVKGTDEYGFEAYPAGRCLNRTVDYTGNLTEFWTSSAVGELYAESGNLAYNMGSLDMHPGENANNYKTSGKSVRCVRNEEVALKSITLKDTEVALGREVQVNATIDPENFNASAIIWRSSDVKIATVDNKGVVKGIKEGTVTITAQSGDIKSECKVKVGKIPVESVQITPSGSTTLRLKESSLSLMGLAQPSNASYPTVSWKSSNTKVATVSPTGTFAVVKPLSNGTVTITATADGVSSTINVTVNFVSAEYDANLTDCEGHTYKTVKIDGKTWMAENLQCITYDAGSETSGTLKKYKTSSDTWSGTYQPYYVDGRNATSSYSSSLSSSQRNKLGLLYSWAAAFGCTAHYAHYRSEVLPGSRQGICPKGWHLPNKTELNSLVKYINTLAGNEYANVSGFYLKAESGWYASGNGVNEFGFNSLPAGSAKADEPISDIGTFTFIQSSTPDFTNNIDGNTYVLKMSHNSGKAEVVGGNNQYAYSVRCVKN